MSEHSGAMVALIPSEADAARLAVDGGEAASELHVTLAYLGDAVDIPASVRQEIIDQVSSAVLGMPVVDADLFAVSVFNPAGDEPCLVYGASGATLDAAHTLISRAAGPASPEQHAPWVAHVTAAYTGDLGRLPELVERLGPVRFDRVRIAFGGETVDIPLIEAGTETAHLIEADRDDTYSAAAAGLILAWPVIAAPLVDSLGAGATGPLAELTPAQAAVDAVAAGLLERMKPLASAAAAATVADAAAQGATVEQVEPDEDHLNELAAITAAMLAASLTATAVEAALITSAAGAAEAVRTALVAAGTAPRGSVATRLRAALSAAEHEGRRAVFEAHPPMAIEAVEEDDACPPCAANSGRRYETLAAALADYQGWGGFSRCMAGAARCRGRLRGIWATAVAEAFSPDQRRDNHGRWVDEFGNPLGSPAARTAASGGRDRLNLGGRIRLGPDESLASSGSVAGEDSHVMHARVDGPDGPRLRLGVGILDEDRGRWAGADRGSTVVLDSDGAESMNRAIDTMQHVAPGVQQRRRELERDYEDLEAMRRRTLARQYPDLSATAQRRVDRIGARIEDIEQRIEGREQSVANSVADLPAPARAEWDRLEQQVADMRADGYTASIPAIRERQAALHDQREDPNMRVGYAGLVQRKLADLDRLRDERDDLRDERTQIAGPPRPLSDDDRRALERVEADLDRVGNDLEPYIEGDPLYSGVVPGEWGNLRYEVSLDSGGQPRYSLQVERPDGSPSDTEVSLDSAALARLRSEIAASMPIAEAAQPAAAGPVELLLVEATF